MQECFHISVLCKNTRVSHTGWPAVVECDTTRVARQQQSRVNRKQKSETKKCAAPLSSTGCAHLPNVNCLLYSTHHHWLKHLDYFTGEFPCLHAGLLYFCFASLTTKRTALQWMHTHGNGLIGAHDVSWPY